MIRLGLKALLASLILSLGVPSWIGTWRAQGLVDHQRKLVEITFASDGHAHVSSDGGANGMWGLMQTQLGDTVVCAAFPRFGNTPVCGSWYRQNDTTAIWGGATFYRVPGTGMPVDSTGPAAE